MHSLVRKLGLTAFIIFAVISLQAMPAADDKDEKNTTSSANPDTIKSYDFPQVDVIGRKPSLINRIPGSADLITDLQMTKTQPVTGNEVFRKVPGLNVVDEEGAGLRVNIGIRGLDPDRSRTVLMMEDGVPIALAPYGEPEMYYTPSIDRMKGIEILKGSGSILFGPQTIGGVINYLTADPPAEQETKLNIRGGGYGYLTGQINYGTTIENVGVYLNYLHRQADKLGVTQFAVNDVTSKIRFNIGPNSRIGIKLAAYNEKSNSTYLGLTQSMYDSEEYFTVMAPNDHLDVERYSAAITHDLFLSQTSYIRTTVFGYTTTRNWLRQDFSRNKSASNLTGVVYGDTSITNGAVYMRNSTGNRDRQFDVAGIEPRIFHTYSFGNIKNDFEGGLRFLFERAYEQSINGKKADAKSGELVADEIRTGYAASAFLQNRIYFTEHLTVIPGVRLESYDYERDIFRISSIDTSITGSSNIFTVVPGLGVNYNFNNVYSIFAGIHRGFAPPRVKDAITNSGQALQLEAELSWNTELGIRANITSALTLELTGFILDFSNQIIPVSVSSGGSGTGLVNGGKTIHLGIESAVKLDIGSLVKSDYDILLSGNLTYTRAKYNADRFVTVNNNRLNIKDNELPYSPHILATGTFEVAAPFGAGLQLTGTYVDKQFTDELNSVNASPSGETGIMPSYFVFDLTGRYFISSVNSSLFVSVKNLLDERYIASRRPQGIKVGIPRLITAGVEVTL